MDVLDDDKLVDKALKTAEVISKWSPKAAKMIKEEIKMNDTYPLNESLSLERKLLLWQTSDHNEGIKSFIEKRDPVYETIKFLHAFIEQFFLKMIKKIKRLTN